MSAVTHPAPARHAVGLGALWFGLFGAPVAWSIQELVSFALVSHACFPSLRPLSVPSGGTWTAALIVGLLTLASGIAAAVTAWRAWQRIGARAEDRVAGKTEVSEGRARFMAMSGLIVSGMILYTMVLNLMALFIVPPCG